MNADTKKILHERAVELAREEEAVDAGKQFIEVAEFTLASERYAIQSIFVREVQKLRDLAPVPCTPPFVAGIINVRSQILTVIDIKRFFDLPQKGITDVHYVIIIRDGATELGVLADLV